MPNEFDLQSILQQGDVMSAMNDLRSMQTPQLTNYGLADLAKFQVNPYKGYLAALGTQVTPDMANMTPPSGGGDPGDEVIPLDIIQGLGVPADVYLKYRNMTINHETGGTMDSRQKQVGGGPGRGLFQFEDSSIPTAAGRVKLYMEKNGLDVPSYVKDAADGKIQDATKLMPQQQEMLFVGQMMQIKDDGGYRLNRAFQKDFNTVEDYAEAWFKTHNRSSSSKKKDRIKKFTEDNAPVFNDAERLIDLSSFAPFKTLEDAKHRGGPPFPITGGTSVPKASNGFSTDQFFGFDELNRRQQRRLQRRIDKANNGSNKWQRRLQEEVNIGNLFALTDQGYQVSPMGPNVFQVIDPSGNKQRVDVTDGNRNGINKLAGSLISTVSGLIPGAGVIGNVIGQGMQGNLGPQAINASSFNLMPSDYGSMGGDAMFGPSPTYEPIGVGNFFGGGSSPFGDSNTMAMMQLLPLLMGNGGNNGGMEGLMSMLGGGFSGMPMGNFDNGGIVPTGERAPIQAEMFKGVPERIVMATGHIALTNAKLPHTKMDDDTITDIVSDGSYVASAQTRTKLKRETFEEIEFGYQDQLYEEGKALEMPRKFTAAEVIPENVKSFLPTEYADMVAKHFPLMEADDIFTQATNNSNLRSRIPYLAALVQTGETKKGEIESMSNGGVVHKAPLGDFLSVAASALPFITQAAQSFNGNSTNGFGSNGLNATNDAMMMASFPLSTIGINRNFNAQNQALSAAQTGLSQLTAEQQRLNNAGTAVGVATAMGQETELERLTQDFSRLTNFRTSTPQQFINAAAAPTQDVASFIDMLGPGASASALANQNSTSIAARNQAAAQAFAQQQQMDLGIAQQVTAGRNAQEQYNNQISQQEVALRNNQLGSIGGQLQGNIQNNSQLLSNQYTGQTQLALQQAGLQGQKEAAIAQQMMNLASTRQSFLNQEQRYAPTPTPAPQLTFGQGQAGGNTLGYTRDDVRSWIPPNTINMPPPTPVNPNPTTPFSQVPTGYPQGPNFDFLLPPNYQGASIYG